MALAPAPYSSAGWMSTTRVPDHSARVSTSFSTAPIIAVTCMSWPQACITGTVVPAGSTPFAVLAYARPVCSSTGSASMSARTHTTGRGKSSSWVPELVEGPSWVPELVEGPEPWLPELVEGPEPWAPELVEGLRSTPTTPVTPTPSSTSSPRSRRCWAAMPAVLVSWNDSSGCWCRSM